MSVKNWITVQFEVEALELLDRETVENRVSELLNPSGSENWFESPDDYARFNENKLSVSVAISQES